MSKPIPAVLREPTAALPCRLRRMFLVLACCAISVLFSGCEPYGPKLRIRNRYSFAVTVSMLSTNSRHRAIDAKIGVVPAGQTVSFSNVLPFRDEVLRLVYRDPSGRVVVDTSQNYDYVLRSSASTGAWTVSVGP